MQVREAAEWVQTVPCGNQVAAPLDSSSTSRLQDTEVDMIMVLGQSSDWVQGLASEAQTAERGGRLLRAPLSKSISSWLVLILLL